MNPETNSQDYHVLDEPLGEIHALAIKLQMMGLSDFAMRLATAHEKIQTYLVEQMKGDV